MLADGWGAIERRACAGRTAAAAYGGGPFGISHIPHADEPVGAFAVANSDEVTKLTSLRIYL
jgi:hypothetical protein